MTYNAFIYWTAYQFSIIYLDSRSMIDIPDNGFLFGFEFMMFFGLEGLQNITQLNHLNQN